MAKKSMINRESKRIRLVQKFAAKRKELKDIVRKIDFYSDEERLLAQEKGRFTSKDSASLQNYRTSTCGLS